MVLSDLDTYPNQLILFPTPTTYISDFPVPGLPTVLNDVADPNARWSNLQVFHVAAAFEQRECHLLISHCSTQFLFQLYTITSNLGCLPDVVGKSLNKQLSLYVLLEVLSLKNIRFPLFGFLSVATGYSSAL